MCTGCLTDSSIAKTNAFATEVLDHALLIHVFFDIHYSPTSRAPVWTSTSA